MNASFVTDDLGNLGQDSLVVSGVPFPPLYVAAGVSLGQAYTWIGPGILAAQAHLLLALFT